MNRQDENELKNLLLEHYANYPLSQIADIFKLLYQNEFGCGHMASDKAHSLNMINAEAKSLPEDTLDGNAFEQIGNGMCRLHLRVLQQGLAPDTLNEFFIYTANQPTGNTEGFERKAAVFLSLCKDKLLPFEADVVSKALDEDRAACVGHSQEFRAAYTPAYRVVSEAFCDFLPLFCKIDELMQQRKCVSVAIDGASAAGKSSLTQLIKSIYACNTFSMDDFFLRPFQRTQERLAEPGGNVDYERFREEIIKPLKAGRQFTYKPYDCRTRELSGPVLAAPNPLNVIEGVYSLHPSLIEAYDIKVFLSVDKAEQRRRLLERNPNMYDRFVHEWMPMENKYFDYFAVSDKCDFVFESNVQNIYQKGGIA